MHIICRQDVDFYVRTGIHKRMRSWYGCYGLTFSSRDTILRKALLQSDNTNMTSPLILISKKLYKLMCVCSRTCYKLSIEILILLAN